MYTKGIIFDFGFTLFYFKDPSIEKYLETFNQGLEKSIEFLKGLKILKDDVIAKKFNKKFNAMRRKLFQASIKSKVEFTSPKIFKEILDLMVEEGKIDPFGKTSEDFYIELADLYHSIEAEVWSPFEKTRETLEKLKEIKDLKLGVLSNHPHHNCITEILDKHDLSGFFDVIITSASYGMRKPDVGIFHHTIKEMGLNKKDIENCIMCGDEYADIVGGHRAGMQTIHCKREFEFPFEKEITMPNIKSIKNIYEILDFVL